MAKKDQRDVTEINAHPKTKKSTIAFSRRWHGLCLMDKLEWINTAGMILIKESDQILKEIYAEARKLDKRKTTRKTT